MSLKIHTHNHGTEKNVDVISFDCIIQLKWMKLLKTAELYFLTATLMHFTHAVNYYYTVHGSCAKHIDILLTNALLIRITTLILH